MSTKNRSDQFPFTSLLCLFMILFFISMCSAEDDSGEYIHYRLGVKYTKEHRYDDAIEEFRKVLATYPDNYNAYMHIAEIRLIQGQSNLAIYNLKKAQKYNPGWNKTNKLLAEAYEKDGQTQNAIGSLQLYMQSCDPSERDSVQNVINIILAKKKKNETIANKSSNSDLPAASTKQNNDNRQNRIPITTGDSILDVEFKKAIALYEQGKYTEALESLKKVRREKPDFAGVYYYAGLIRYNSGQIQMAKVNLLKAVDYPEPGNLSHFFLGKLYGEEKNYAEALTSLKKYVIKATDEKRKKEALELIKSYQMNPSIKITGQTDSDSSMVTSDTISNRKIPQETVISSIEIQIDSLLSMLTVDTLTDAGQKLLNGIRAFSNGNFDQSIREFKRTLATNPNGTVALNCIYNTGICYYKMHLFKDAENQFQQVIEKFPDNVASAQSQFLKACTYLERENFSIAENLLRTFLQKNKNHRWTGVAFEKLGDAYSEMEQDKKSIDAYQQAVLKSNNPDEQTRTFFKLGNTFSKIGNPSKAIESFMSVIAIGEKQNANTRVPEAYYRIADEKYKQKDYQGALEFYTKVTRKYPSFQETPWGLFQIGTIYKNLKQYQNAVSMYKGLIKNFPDDYWAKQAQWKLEDAIWENQYQAVLKE